MDDGFLQALTPEELKLTTLQFLGQHLTGDLKELNKNIVSQNRTLQGMTLDPLKVINSVPAGHGAPPPMATAVNAGINVQQPMQNVTSHITTGNSTAPAVVKYEADQLEFNFDNSQQARSIFERLDAINSKLDKLLDIFKENN